MDRSEQLNELAAALCAAQQEIEDAGCHKSNPAFRSKYADLGSVVDACKPALTKHGLCFAQVFEPAERGVLALTTVLMHKSGQWISGTCWIPLVKEDPQGYGSAATYARRYGLAAIVGVCPDDDDGNAASQRDSRRFQPPAAHERPAPPPQPAGSGVPPKCVVCQVVVKPEAAVKCREQTGRVYCKTHYEENRAKQPPTTLIPDEPERPAVAH